MDSSDTILSSPSSLQVQFLRVGSEGLLENARVVALLEHVQVHPLLVLEPNPLGVCVRVEGVHQDQGDVTAVLVVDILGRTEFAKSVCVRVCEHMYSGLPLIWPPLEPIKSVLIRWVVSFQG